MRILLYHKRLSGRTEHPVLDRAAQRKHMLHKTILWDIALVLVSGILGPLLHLYAPLLCRMPVLAVLVPVNESVWEHLKLLFFPAALTACIRYCCTGNLQKGILSTIASGLWRTMLLMVCGFYSISGILGGITLWTDIALFYFCAVYLTIFVRQHANTQRKNNLPGIVFLLLLTGCFIWFTYHPPGIGLFQVI